jgi:hypothetical protein
MADYDSPWKDALDLYFQSFLALFFPLIYADIDWSRGYESLDKEFQQVVRDAEVGRRYVDKLVKVWRRDGAEQWVLVHVEVQTTPDPEMPLRMYVYNYRIFDRYNREVVSLAVLADDDPQWRPGRYRSELWGCVRQLDFVPVKLLDYAQHEAALEASDNPFAHVLLAHLKVLHTRRDAADRHAWKVRLVRGLYERGFSVKDVRELFRLIDWLMELPPALDRLFWDEVKQIQEDKKMPFITTPERIGMEKGMKEGMKEGLFKGIEAMLEVRFGPAGLQLLPEIRQVQDQATLEAVLDASKTAAAPEELRRIWSPPG